MPARYSLRSKMPKRKQSDPSKWGQKKRRTHRYVPYNARFAVRVPRSMGITTRTESSTDVRQKGLTEAARRQYRQNLWNFSQIQTKFRSILSASVTLATPASTTLQGINVNSIFDEANPFWTAAGGNQSVRFGVAAGSANPDSVIIRGGVYEIVFTCLPATGDNINLRYQLIMPKQQMQDTTDAAVSNTGFAWLAAIPLATSPIGLTIQDLPDYNEYFYPPFLDKEVVLRPGESCKEIKKIRLKKVDAQAFHRGFTTFPLLVCYANGTSDATADLLRIQKSYNLTYTIPDI